MSVPKSESLKNPDEYTYSSSASPFFRIVTILKDTRWNNVPGLEAIISRSASVARNFLGEFKEGEEEVCVVLTSDTELRSHNLAFRSKDSPTNVLSFPVGNFPVEGHIGPVPKGDIILAFETIECEARELNISFEHHLAHLTVHGLLHLFGFDHQTETEANEMENLEIQILENLGIANPYEISELKKIEPCPLEVK